MLLLLQRYINIYGYKEITIKLMPISGFNVLNNAINAKTVIKLLSLKQILLKVIAFLKQC